MSEQIPAWYTATPQELAGPPGTIIRQERVSNLVPVGAEAWKILYRSTGLEGEPIAVSALLALPGDDVPAGGRPIVAWAHPTTGVTQACAPSLVPDALRTVMGLSRFLSRGQVVVATDYPGLGTPGQHPYLIGVSEARAVLDAVRAARNFPTSHAGDRFAVWGHSQGGHAVLHTGMLAHTYAPELHLVGIAAAAPATELKTLMAGPGTDPTLQAMLIRAWSRLYNLPLDTLAAPGEQAKLMLVGQQCLDSPRDSEVQPPEAPPSRISYTVQGSIGTTEPWASIAERNSTGLIPAHVPVFLALGGADTLIPLPVNVHYMQRLCKAGVHVRELILPGVDHHFIGRDAAEAAVDWISDRFAGKPVPDDCH